MYNQLLQISVWAIPLSLSIIMLSFMILQKKYNIGSYINWNIVDLIWISTSAVTLYFFAFGILYDKGRNEAQISQNNYLTHLARGRDLANENLEVFCLGSNRRKMNVASNDSGNFCRYNSNALFAFTAAIARFQKNNTISSERDIKNIPQYIVKYPMNEDLLILNTKWVRVRNEFEFQNEAANRLKDTDISLEWPAFFSKLRVFWIYVYILAISMRLSRPIFDNWFKSEPSPP